jgi:hypothetical protein
LAVGAGQTRAAAGVFTSELLVLNLIGNGLGSLAFWFFHSQRGAKHGVDLEVRYGAKV